MSPLLNFAVVFLGLCAIVIKAKSLSIATSFSHRCKHENKNSFLRIRKRFCH